MKDAQGEWITVPVDSPLAVYHKLLSHLYPDRYIQVLDSEQNPDWVDIEVIIAARRAVISFDRKTGQSTYISLYVLSNPLQDIMQDILRSKRHDN